MAHAPGSEGAQGPFQVAASQSDQIRLKRLGSYSQTGIAFPKFECSRFTFGSTIARGDG